MDSSQTTLTDLESVLRTAERFLSKTSKWSGGVVEWTAGKNNGRISLPQQFCAQHLSTSQDMGGHIRRTTAQCTRTYECFECDLCDDGSNIDMTGTRGMQLAVWPAQTQRLWPAYQTGRR
eukprot:352476-Chlamydomonas_euryale.AAC.22